MKKLKIIILTLPLYLFLSCYFDAERKNPNDPRSDNYVYYFYETQWGGYGSSNGLFNAPCGIALDSGSNVYVIDSENDRVQKFSSGGTYITQWDVWNPSNIAIDSGDTVCVNEGSDILKFDTDGNPIATTAAWQSISASDAAIAIDSNKNVYVASTFSLSYEVEKYDSSGNPMISWGSYGTDSGEFEYIKGLAAGPGDYIYVSEGYSFYPYSNRIQKFTPNGAYVIGWGSYGTGNGQFNIPKGIATDSGGNVYVADSGNNRIQKFDSNGNYIIQLGSFGTGNGQFNNPSGIAVDSSGNVYVADTDNNRIQKFRYRPRP